MTDQTTGHTCGSLSLPTYSGEVVRCVLATGHEKQCQSATEHPMVSWPNPSNGEWHLAAAGVRDAARQASGQQPAADETHVVADDSDDPEHVDDCPGCEVGIEHTEHCPTPETHNWGCGCPTDQHPAVGVQDATQPPTTCICGHPAKEHFEDACLVCDCGDYLEPDAAREVIARWRTAALKAQPTTDETEARDRLLRLSMTGPRDHEVTEAAAAYRAAILNSSAAELEAGCPNHDANGGRLMTCQCEAATELRRLAAGAES